MIATNSFGASRASRLDAILQKKKRIPLNEKREQLKKSSAQDAPKIESGDTQSIKRRVSSDAETREIKPGIKIPRPTKELSLEELIAIAQRYQDPNKPYVVAMRLCKDGKSLKYYSDGSIKEIMPYKIDYQPFSGELAKLVDWYLFIGPLPLAPFKRDTGLSINNEKNYYEWLNSMIVQGANGVLAQKGLLQKELECLKRVNQFIAQR